MSPTRGRTEGVAYLDEGPRQGPALLLANSLGTTTALWEPQVEVWSRYFRVIRYELPGHGQSLVGEGAYTLERLGGDALGLLERLGVERFSVCGLSLGGMVGLWLAAHSPQRVESLVAACTAASFPPASSWLERAQLVRQEGLAALRPRLLERWLSADFRGRFPDRAAQVGALLDEVDGEGYARCCEALAAADLGPGLSRVGASCLVLAGAEDPAVPAAATLALWQGLPGAGLRILAGASHLANVEQPQVFADAVTDHLLGAPSGRGARARRQVLGDRHMDRALAQANPVTRDFQDLITRFAWGEVWSRPQLDRRSRRLLTIALLVAQGRFEELEMHLRAAGGDLTRAEVVECLLQTAVYCGVPLANAAFQVADRVLGEDRADG